VILKRPALTNSSYFSDDDNVTVMYLLVDYRPFEPLAHPCMWVFKEQKQKMPNMWYFVGIGVSEFDDYEVHIEMVWTHESWRWHRLDQVLYSDAGGRS